jgi:uncharacterized membrane protein
MLMFLKTTILGGILFLVPIVIFIAVLGKAVKVVDKIAVPIAALLPLDSFGGVAVVEIIALAILVLVCFIAGLAAKTRTARKMVHLLESNVLENIPAYALLKAKSGSILTPEDTSDMQPVLIQFDDSWQIGFEIDKAGADKRLVFLPGAPDPWSGSVCAVTVDRLQPLAMNIKEISVFMKRLGKGSSPALVELIRGQAPRS